MSSASIVNDALRVKIETKNTKQYTTESDHPVELAVVMDSHLSAANVL